MERRTVYETDVADLISKEFDIPFAELVDAIGKVQTAKANIDTEKLKDNVCNGCIYLKGTLEECRKWCDLMTDIDNAPREEPKHGTWIPITETIAKCSVCNSSFSTHGKDKTLNAHIHMALYNFCPHCGAYMRGETE